MKSLAALAFAFAGCSDPGYICDQNRAHTTWDGACDFAPSMIEIDGDLGDWAPLLVYPPDCSDCRPGEVAGVYVTETTNGEVAIFAQTVGAPLMDTRHRYDLQLTPLVLPPYALEFLVTPGGVETVVGYTVSVTGLPVRAAVGPTGIELAIPISALPFTAGANGWGVLEGFQLGTWEIAQDVTPFLASVCWDASSPLCQPTHNIF
jgi:hypothetical protein